MIDQVDPTETASYLRRVLEAVEAGEMTATEQEIDRMRGAAIALAVLADGPP